MAAIRIDKRTLRIGNKDVVFDKDVENFIERDGITVVLLYTGDYEKGDPMVGRNVLGFDGDGNEAWRVEDHGYTIGPDDVNRVPQSFMSIWIGPESGKLKAGIPYMLFSLDAKTGMLSDPEYNR